MKRTAYQPKAKVTFIVDGIQPCQYVEHGRGGKNPYGNFASMVIHYPGTIDLPVCAGCAGPALHDTLREDAIALEEGPNGDRVIGCIK